MTDVQAGPTGLTFSSLEDDLKRYAERGGTLDEAIEVQIPRIINNSERDLADRLRILGYLAPYVSRMKIGQPRIAKPANWRSTVSINFGTGVEQRNRKTLRERSYEYVRTMYPDDSQLGEPKLYADYDVDHWLIKPSPNDTYPFEALVWRLPDLLSPSNQTNYLTDYAPNLLLFTSMQGLSSYLKDLASATYWENLAEKRFANIDTQDKKRMVDRAQMRSTD